MTDIEKREKLHQILDLVIDINGFEDRKVELTGDKPTAFIYFSGHTSNFEVNVHTHGYENFKMPDVRMDSFIDKDNPMLDEIIRTLEEIKEGTDTSVGAEGV